MSDRQAAATTALEMAGRQKEISVLEFFLKNRHLLGSDTPVKPLVTAVKEAENALDACEEAGVLPEITVEVRGRFERSRVAVEDNGLGIVESQIACILGKLLYGLKFHKLSQSRGQQGMGISATERPFTVGVALVHLAGAGASATSPSGVARMERLMVWWKKAVVYHIYPRSFEDSDDDGVGDLDGVRKRLDYLVWLGVDAIWLSPFYKSPMKDFGYDVSDYCEVAPLFGSMECFDALITDAHARGLKIILDFVPNHTSSLHPWFLSGRRSRDDPKRDWYIWRDPAPGGGPPNNWVSHFGGSGWTFDEETQQYYYHAFLEEQPDLNWRNPEVRAAMQDVLRFWLKRGVDGFRIDVASHLIKDAAFRDNPPNPHYDGRGPDIQRLAQTYSSDQPEVQEIIAGLRRVVEEFDGDRLLIGELYLPVDRLVRYYGEGLRGLHLPFNFQLLDARWSADDIRRLIEKYEAALPEGAWPNWVLSNHDRPRVAARVGEAQARIAAMLILTLRGTPTLYYGDEIGLGNVPVAPDRIRDTWALRESGPGVGRDPARTPMQWEDGPFAGFSSREPWLPLSPDHATRNVSVMRQDKSSILLLVRELLHYRRKHEALEQGAWRALGSADDVLCYERVFGGERIVILLNFSAEPRCVDGLGLETTRISLSTHADRRGEAVREVVDLRPNEGLILESS